MVLHAKILPNYIWQAQVPIPSLMLQTVHFSIKAKKVSRLAWVKPNSDKSKSLMMGRLHKFVEGWFN